MNKKIASVASVCIIFLGIFLLGSGLILIKSSNNAHGIMLTLPYLCIGVGCGIFGLGLGYIINNRIIKNNPDVAKRIKIIQEDERNIAINNRAKAKTYDIMIYVYGALILAFTLIGSNLGEVLLLIAAYLCIIFYHFFSISKYEKEM